LHHAAPREPSGGAEGSRFDHEPEPTGILGAITRRGPFYTLRFRQYRLIWWGHVATGLATWMDQVARGWLLYELTDSPLQLGLVRAVQAIPFLLLSPIAGSVADRYERRTLVIWAQVLHAIFYGIVAWLILAGLIEPWHVYVSALAQTLVQVFEQPARQSMQSDSVPLEHLTSAIGLGSLVFNASRTVGPAIAGLLIAAYGTGSAYVVETALYVVATVWTLQLDPGRAGDALHRRAESFRQSIADGWHFIVGNDTVRIAMTISMLSSFLAMPFASMLPVFARDILLIGAQGQGLLLTGMGIGAVSAAFMIAAFGERLPRGPIMIAALAAYGLAIVAFAASPWFLLSFVLMTVTGLCNVSTHALIQTVVQTNTPSELRGRVMSVFQQNQVATTLGSAVTGLLATLLDAQLAVGIMGLLAAASAVMVVVLMPRAREIR
jgi:MFS family permease